ncbi:MAG: MFS transporter [Saezia sp.]
MSVEQFAGKSEGNELTPAQNRQAWRYVHLLLLAQAVGASSPPIIISLGGLIGLELAADKALATLPVSLYHIGLALSMLPVTFLIRRWGRQRTYMMGTAFAFSGGVIAAWGVWQSSFLIFCVGTALAGCYAACVQNYRFAVTDYVPKREQPQAISRVMLGGIAAAVIGPQLAIWGTNLFSTPFVGSYLSQSMLAVFAFFVVLQIGKVSAGLPLQGGVVATDASGAPKEVPRSLLEILSSFKLASTIFAAVISYGLMTFLMTATPMAMKLSGHSISHATLGVQWHILAMYLPSFITGRLMLRYGQINVTISGLLLIGLSCLVYVTGEGLVNFWGGFILLGVGWNFGFIGATSMLTDCYRPSERTKVQGLNDMMVFGTMAIASLLSGQLLYHVGWASLNWMALPLVLIAVLLLFIRKTYKGLAQ